MARTFKPADGKKLIQAHRDLRTELSKAAATAEGYRQKVEFAATAMQNEAVRQLLKGLPVEELNRTKRGIRVKLLRDAGYGTVGDVYGLPAFSLSAINGIGSDSANYIVYVVNQMAAEVRAGIKIRLSADEKTELSTALISALSAYRRSQAYASAAARLLKAYGRDVENACEAIDACSGNLTWMFASSDKKEAARQGYAYLQELLGGTYYRAASGALQGISRVRLQSAEDAWQHYRDEPIAFSGTLEDVCPGILGSNDVFYGLPEELASAVREEKLALDGLNCELRRYQEWGVRYILHQEKVLLGDEMGLGKTVQAIAAMVALRNTGETHFMVICPASVLSNWGKEIKKHSDLKVTEIYGQDRSDELSCWIKGGGVAVTTFETVSRIHLEDDFKFCMLTVDEAHYVKNPEANRTIYTKMLCGHASRLLFMTGTALENRVDEMISLIGILRPEVAMQLKALSAMPAAPIFREKAASVYYRRKREDVLTELPELIEKQEWCVLNDTETEAYESAVLSKNFAAARRVSWNVDDPLNSTKGARLKEIIEEAAAEDRKVIVFSFFLDTIQKVQALLGSTCFGPINGQTPPKKRQEIIDAFNNAPAGSILVSQIQSGGTGLNIQSASVVVICEPQLKPSTENQAISRAYRMGQTRNVIVYRLLADETIDERILDMLEQKQAVFDAFADKSQAAAAENAELDDKTLSALLEAEIERIRAKNGGKGTPPGQFAKTSEPSSTEEKQKRDRFCRNCGASIPAGAKFCPKCGNKL